MWDVVSAERLDRWDADVAVTGEGYVLLNLLEVLPAIRGGGESVLMTCLRGRNGGRLDDIPGLVYA